MEKSAQAGEGGGARPSPLTIFTITYNVAVYDPAERADTLFLFNIYPCVLCGVPPQKDTPILTMQFFATKEQRPFKGTQAQNNFDFFLPNQILICPW
jgi:hypothetical protein